MANPMRLGFVYGLVLIKCLSSVLAFEPNTSSPTENVLPNSNHIFNAVHSSMRQWGSSLNHNGMSFFLATVPENTKLYHGSSTDRPLEGIGWMAFDPEHAMVFAHGVQPHSGQSGSSENGRISPEQQPLLDGESNKGWLHTYSATNDLRLILVDGMSAGKSDIGTLDSQDILIFNDTLPVGGVTQENNRAHALCKKSQNEWGGRIDGIIRLAAGYEIILCSPQNHLQVVRMATTEFAPKGKIASTEFPNNVAPKKGKPGELLRTITSRYDGIGGDRVQVHFHEFVTAYNHSFDLFPAGSRLPRLRHIESSDLDVLRHSLTSLAMSDLPTSGPNWQSITDMIVLKYAGQLRSLASGKLDTREKLSSEVGRIWAPFIDHNKRDYAQEINHCATEIIPENTIGNSLAAQAVFGVTYRICHTLAAVITSDDFATSMQMLQDLVNYLGWSSWKKCHDCSDDEFCAIPIWPSGTQADYDHPRCQLFDNAYSGINDYWGPVWR